jgi:multidrug resistance efflux pump
MSAWIARFQSLLLLALRASVTSLAADKDRMRQEDLALLNDDWEQKHSQAMTAKDNEKQFALLEQAKQHAEAMKKKATEKQNELDGLLATLENTRTALRDEKVRTLVGGFVAWWRVCGTFVV